METVAVGCLTIATAIIALAPESPKLDCSGMTDLAPVRSVISRLSPAFALAFSTCRAADESRQRSMPSVCFSKRCSALSAFRPHSSCIFSSLLSLPVGFVCVCVREYEYIITRTGLVCVFSLLTQSVRGAESGSEMLSLDFLSLSLTHMNYPQNSA